MTSPKQDVAAATSQGTAKRFYRPELDALRFFAFLAVLLHHGPHATRYLTFFASAGGLGLSMFFLLSAYLITELLLREREQSGTVAWGFFFTRRALRIWPLYYAALAAAVVISLIPPHLFWISGSGIAFMSLFMATWVRLPSQLGILVGQLWSISVEEQFYLIWPPIVKYGGKRLAIVISVLFMVTAAVWLGVFSGKGWMLWYDTPVEFLFFAAGALIAIATRGNSLPGVNGRMRGLVLIAGASVAIVTIHFSRIGSDNVPGLTAAQLYIGYGGAAAGCVLIFLGVLGMSGIPQWLTYLGKISYGLYVFHVGIIELSTRLAVPFRLASDSAAYLFLVDGIALVLCVLVSHLSYQYFERPFLKLKERFEVIKTRPA